MLSSTFLSRLQQQLRISNKQRKPRSLPTSLSSVQRVNSRYCRGRTTSPGKVVVSDSETAELNIRMAQQHQKVSKYTFAQLCQAVEELKKLTEQLNDNSKSLDLR